MAQISINDFNSYLNSLADNTIETPYEIEISETLDSTQVINNSMADNKKYVSLYVNLSSTIVSSNVSFKDNEYLVKFRGTFSSNRTNLTNFFYNCTSLTEAPVIPNGVTNLDSCFSNCKSLTKAPVIPNGVTDMSACFHDCISLTEAPIIPNSVTDMNNCFNNCKSLTEVPIIPNSVTNMNYCFSYCTSLTEAPIIPNGITNLRSCFFFCSSLTEAPVIPNGVTNLDSCFSNCKSLTKAPVIPNGVTNMYCCFNNCKSLTEAPIIPNSVTDLRSCFAGCTSLIRVLSIPNTISTMSYCFSNCSSLVVIDNWDLDINANGTTMTNAFSGCTSLTRINTTSTCKKDKGDGKWQLVRVVTNGSDNTKYDIDVIELKSGTESSLTVDKATIRSYFTDEMMFSPQGAITDQVIEDFINYRFPWRTKETDIAVGGKKHFFVQASDDSIIHQNIFDPSSLNIPTKTSDLTNDSGFITSSGSITGSSGSCTGNAATATTASSCSGNAATATKASTYSGNVTVISSASTQTASLVDRRFVVTSNVTLTLGLASLTQNGVIAEVFAVTACSVKYYTSSGATSTLSMVAGTRATFIFYNGWKYYGVYGAVWN